MSTANDSLAIGLDIGGTGTKAVVINARGDVIAQSNEPTTPAGGGKAEVLERLRNRIESLRSQVARPIEFCGTAIPGIGSRDERYVEWLPKGKVAIDGVNFTEAFRWPRPVPVLNDAHAALFAEVRYGAAESKRDVVLLTLGTGVGGAILADGRLVKGAIGRAGHLGHIGLGNGMARSVCNMPGSLEMSIGDVGLPLRSNGRFKHTGELLQAISAGDTNAGRIWDRSIRDLAYAIAAFINMLDPEIILLGGGIAEAKDRLLTPLRAYVEDLEWRPTGTRVPIEHASLGEWAGAIGAAARAFEVAS